MAGVGGMPGMGGIPGRGGNQPSGKDSPLGSFSTLLRPSVVRTLPSGLNTAKHGMPSTPQTLDNLSFAARFSKGNASHGISLAYSSKEPWSRSDDTKMISILSFKPPL